MGDLRSDTMQAAVAVALLAVSCHAVPSRSPVQRIPGYGPPPTRHHSGFVEVDPATDTHLFYYLVESADAPATDPLVWWFNGGPGASSLAGLFNENGPVLLNDQKELIDNPYSWNQHANVLYVEFAPGIGFSYCRNSTRTDSSEGCLQASGDCSPCLASDTSVATQNVAFIDGFMRLFPDLAGRPLTLAGESYAGVYGPTLAAAIINHFPDTTVANLTSLWLTDPCTDNKAQGGWLDLGPDFVFRAGVIDKALHTALTSSECTISKTPNGDRVRQLHSIECRRAWRLYDIATNGIGDAAHAGPIPGLPMYIDPLNALGPSGGADLSKFVGSLRSAVNANSSKNAVYHLELGNNGYDGYTIEYAACNQHPTGALSHQSMIDVYRRLAEYASKPGEYPAAASLRRILISSGDVDPVVALPGTAAAVRAIGWDESQSGRLPWFYNCSATPQDTIMRKAAAWGRDLQPHDIGVQMGGFSTMYETGSVMAEFITFQNSGHMVPAYAPQRALHTLNRILRASDKPMTPPLPADWDEVSDDGFYARNAGGKQKGLFATWVQVAMSSEYV